MSGSGKPGVTFKFTVVSVKGSKATIQAQSEDIAYLIPGNNYVGSFLPTPANDASSSDVPAPDPNA